MILKLLNGDAMVKPVSNVKSIIKYLFFPQGLCSVFFFFFFFFFFLLLFCFCFFLFFLFSYQILISHSV